MVEGEEDGHADERYTQNENRFHFALARVARMLVVTRFRVPDGDAGAFRTGAEDLLGAAARAAGLRPRQAGPGRRRAGPVGAGHRVDGVGAYRRALSAYDVKMSALAELMAYAVHEPSAFEVASTSR